MKDERLVWVVTWIWVGSEPCLNWFMTDNPGKSTGIISRHSGSEQDRPKELPLWVWRYGSLHFFLLQPLNIFLSRFSGLLEAPLIYAYMYTYIFFTWFSVCPVTQVIDSTLLKATFRSLTFSMHHWQQIFQAWLRELLSLWRSPWHRLVFIGVLSGVRCCQGSSKWCI